MKGYRIRCFQPATVVVVAISAFVLTGCIPEIPPARYVQYKLEVTRSVFREGVPEPVTNLSDGGVKVDWELHANCFYGVFSNHMNIDLKILWEGAEFSYGGESEPLIKLRSSQTSDLPQPPTTIPSNSKVELLAIPLSYAMFGRLPQDGQIRHGSWNGFLFMKDIGDIYFEGSKKDLKKKDLKKLGEKVIGRQFDIKIPIQFEDKILVNEFHIRIVDVKVKAQYFTIPGYNF